MKDFPSIILRELPTRRVECDAKGTKVESYIDVFGVLTQREIEGAKQTPIWLPMRLSLTLTPCRMKKQIRNSSPHSEISRLSDSRKYLRTKIVNSSKVHSSNMYPKFAQFLSEITVEIQQGYDGARLHDTSVVLSHPHCFERLSSALANNTCDSFEFACDCNHNKQLLLCA